MRAPSWLVVVGGLVLPALVLLPLPEGVTLAAAAVLLGVLPGLALARAARLGDVLLAVLVTLLGSMAVTIAASSALLYLEVWSGAALCLLVAGCTVALEIRWGGGEP
jgi:hypothetical protein